MEKNKAGNEEESIMGRRSHNRVVCEGLTEEVTFKMLEGSGEDVMTIKMS